MRVKDLRRLAREFKRGLDRVDKKSASKSGSAERRSYLYIFLI